jgi:TPR repeat protein
MALAAGVIGLAAVAHAADDTARFYGTWKTSFLYNGQTVTMLSVHDANGYKNYVVTPTGNQPFGDGTFSAANGKWTSSAAAPNDGGAYHFINASTVVCTNSAGQSVTWRREKAAPTTPTPPPGLNNPPTPTPQAPPQQGPKAEFVPDPSLSPQVNAAFRALREKDYNTAWRGLMAEAQKGDADAEAGVGMMLFNNQNPPGTGYYAQCEKWLTSSANKGNVHGMYFLAMYYNEVGKNLSQGINPGVNNYVAPAQRAEAEKKFALARMWFQRAADKGDGYAMANLAIMVDSGIGGPRDPAYAAQLRAQSAKLVDPNYKKRALDNPSYQAMTMAWQAGHYADALKTAQEQAAKGDASAQALLGKAYYEGVGVPRNYSTALNWNNKAVAQNNPDAMFILGLMYEHGRGVPQDLDRALKLFDRAGELGQRYAQMEAKGMRMQGEANRTAALAHGNSSSEDIACQTAGGVSTPGACIRGGENIDPFNPYAGSEPSAPEPVEPTE